MHNLVFADRGKNIAAGIASLLAILALFVYVSAPAGAEPKIESTYEKSNSPVVEGVVDGDDLDQIEVRVVFFANGQRVERRIAELRDDGSFTVPIPEGADEVRIVIVSPDGKLVRVFEVRPGQSLDLTVTTGGGGSAPVPLFIPY